MASFMEKFRVSKKEYENMPCALISLMMLDAPKVLYGKRTDGHSSTDKAAIQKRNETLRPTQRTMAEIRKDNGK